MSEEPEVWTASHPMTGEWLIECDGWAFATLHYDYRYTCNAQMHYRAEWIVSAPQLKADNARLRAALAEAEREKDELRARAEKSESDYDDRKEIYQFEARAERAEADLAAAREVIGLAADFITGFVPAHALPKWLARARAFLERTATAADPLASESKP